jgi:CemA family
MAGELTSYWQRMNQWFFRTADRALDEAYKAALKIQAIEEQHFDGQKIPNGSPGSYFQADLNKYLNIAKLRLAEFQTSRSLNPTDSRSANLFDLDSPEVAAEAQVLAKLELIDAVLARYRREVNALNTTVSAAPESIFTSFDNPLAAKPQKKSIMDRSIVNTVKKIRQELDPQAEEELVTNFRSSQNRTLDSLRFVLFIALVPLIVHFVSKFIFFGPVIDAYYPKIHKENIFLNRHLEKEALEELEGFERHLRFQKIANITPDISAEEIEEKVKARAIEIRASFVDQSANAVQNWFADITAILVFIFMLSRSKAEIANLRAFIDSLISGVSDTAKAFVIILFSDIFVGFHSPHGWDFILVSIANHFGIPENHNFNSLFIATFPVFLDTVFKYWIFRYLSGQSPSSVATYKTMNE